MSCLVHTRKRNFTSLLTVRAGKYMESNFCSGLPLLDSEGSSLIVPRRANGCWNGSPRGGVFLTDTLEAKFLKKNKRVSVPDDLFFATSRAGRQAFCISTSLVAFFPARHGTVTAATPITRHHEYLPFLLLFFLLPSPVSAIQNTRWKSP